MRRGQSAGGVRPLGDCSPCPAAKKVGNETRAARRVPRSRFRDAERATRVQRGRGLSKLSRDGGNHAEARDAINAAGCEIAAPGCGCVSVNAEWVIGVTGDRDADETPSGHRRQPTCRSDNGLPTALTGFPGSRQLSFTAETRPRRPTQPRAVAYRGHIVDVLRGQSRFPPEGVGLTRSARETPPFAPTPTGYVFSNMQMSLYPCYNLGLSVLSTR